MNLKCDYEITGGGSLGVKLHDIEDLTPEGVERWLRDGAEIEIVDKCTYNVRLRPRYTPKQLSEAIEAEKQSREEEEDDD
jgi:hypothetical protein